MRALCVVAVATLALTACGGGSGSSGATATTTTQTESSATVPTPDAPSTATKTPKTIDYQAQYLYLVGPVNTALDKLKAYASANPNADKVPDSLVTATRGAFTTFENAVLRVPWPTATVPDIHALVTAAETVSANLGEFNNQDTSSIVAFNNQSVKDDATLSAAINIVRADVGLPPAK